MWLDEKLYTGIYRYMYYSVTKNEEVKELGPEIYTLTVLFPCVCQLLKA